MKIQGAILEDSSRTFLEEIAGEASEEISGAVPTDFFKLLKLGETPRQHLRNILRETKMSVSKTQKEFRKKIHERF